jgi:citrate synthase
VTETYSTSIGTADATSITVLGQNLADDLMGKISFGELAFWLAALRRPAPGELRMFETVLVALADHGFTPSVIAARLTLTGAPESVQGALAAGLLGGGSRYLGVTEDCARFLNQALEAHSGPLPETDAGWDEIAIAAVQAQRTAGKLVPGLGHPIHKNGDPRTPVIFRVAEESGVLGPHLRLFGAVGRVSTAIIGRSLPLNGAGVCGAALADLGFPADLLRGFALLARTAGLIGHLAEEMRKPAGNDIYRDVDEAIEYVAPPAE